MEREYSEKTPRIVFEGMTYEERFVLVSTPVPFDQLFARSRLRELCFHPQEFLFIHAFQKPGDCVPVPAAIPDEQALTSSGFKAPCKGAVYRPTLPIVERMIYWVHQRVQRDSTMVVSCCWVMRLTSTVRSEDWA